MIAFLFVCLFFDNIKHFYVTIRCITSASRLVLLITRGHERSAFDEPWDGQWQPWQRRSDSHGNTDQTADRSDSSGVCLRDKGRLNLKLSK